MQPILVNIIITSIRSRKDGSLGFSSETPELSVDEKVAFMNLQGVNVKALLESVDDSSGEVLKVDADLNSKSQSQRIKAVLFVLWKQRGEQGKFTDFYNEKTEKFIDIIKGQLE